MSKTLIIDNGSYEIKLDYYKPDIDSNLHIPIKLNNSIVRTNDKRLALGNSIDDIQNISNLYFKRPYEKNQLVSWEIEKLIWDYSFNSIDLNLFVDPADCNLVLTESPLTLPKLSNNLDQIVFEEYGFKKYYRAPAASFIPFNTKKNISLLSGIDYNSTKVELEINNGDNETKYYSDFKLIIDSGFDSTFVIPVIYGCIYWKGVKKLDIGGRFLTGFLREVISFRYYNVADETMLVNNIKEQSCFVAEDYNKSLGLLKKDRIFSIIEFVLPDFKTTTRGFVLTNSKKKELFEKGINPDEDCQILKLYDERFSVPETIFDPEICGIRNKCGLIKTIHDCIQSVPELVRPLLVSNIVCVGGNFKLKGFKQRLIKELNQVLPIDWDVKVAISEDPSIYSWQSMNELVKNHDLINKVYISKEEYDEKGAAGIRYCQSKFGFKI
ncbi:Arp6p [Ascoidea rubescens DSM 1968]|uniref:Actin-like protein ARP6 n=1 Tax=Ascoidea rubescens DSM 1968 TaxID=1344418 RepID=A0A1D2VPM0_9ASCO|nr:actin-like ATPase domain-containing protein [Ascoidea rubescens DSM 1968]ODV63561.1 actin-like ATPase domain-containing protein [Ascoidea rubescens DSM 1968]